MSEIAEVIEVTEKRFTSIAPAGMLYDAEKGFVVQLLKNNNYLHKIAESAPGSLQQAMCNVASIGLSLSPAEHLAYLVPRGGKICLDVSYQGFCRLATNSGSIQWIQAQLVYANDNFRVNEVGVPPTHDYEAFGDRGEIKGGYCIAKTHEGDYLTTIMTIAEIEGIRDRSEAWKRNQSGPWKTDFGEMAKKTVVRRAFKMWPRTDEHQLKRMAIAVQLSNEAEQFEQLKTSPEITQYTDEQKVYFDQLIEKSDALGMLVFSKSIEEGAFSSLYNSFEHGKKGQYKQLVNDLITAGFDQSKDYANRLVEAAGADDELAVAELQGELSEEEMELILTDLPEPVVAFVQSIGEEDAD